MASSDRHTRRNWIPSSLRHRHPNIALRKSVWRALFHQRRRFSLRQPDRDLQHPRRCLDLRSQRRSQRNPLETLRSRVAPTARAQSRRWRDSRDVPRRDYGVARPNGDDEADFYESVSRLQKTSSGGHDFITGLERDNSGRWFFASGNQGLCRVDGGQLDVLATGLRNPNGLGISPDGRVILTSVQEGSWTPGSAICDVSLGGHFGAGGPREGERGYVPPMLYLPRGVDNSSGGQVFIDSDRWGPVRGQWLHFFLWLREALSGFARGN